MLNRQRKEAMLSYIQQNQKATVRELSERFGVTGETVRRDLAELRQEYPLRKVHGGVMLIRTAEREVAYEERKLRFREEKAAIGRCAASLLSDNDIIALDHGASADELAEAIYGVKNLTVFTDSLNIAQTLSRKLKDGDFTGRILLPAGVVTPQSGLIGGTKALADIRRYRFDKLFFSVTGVTPEGCMDWNPEDMELTALLMERSAECYCLSESEKFGKESICRLCDFHAINRMITDDRRPVPEDIAAAIKEAGMPLTVVPCDPTGTGQ